MSLQPGDTLGVYEILEPIGRGGMGEVFRARDPRMGREVAIKVSSEAFSERFSREVQAIAALNHPNVCTVYDVGPNYLVMELIEGPTLADLIEDRSLTLDDALRIARQVADALEAAHDHGIVHRDLKPGNIKIKPDGTVKVLDFGLAKLGGTPTASASSDSPTLTMQATQAGVILGTAAYMAPEQARGKAVDRRADIWAFGVVLHEMVTGRRLFQGEDLTDTLAAVVRTAPDLSDAPPSLHRLLARCVEKDPTKRLRHIGAARELLDDGPRTAPAAPAAEVHRGPARFVPWVGVGLLAVALAALAWVHFRETPSAPAPHAVALTVEPPPDATFATVHAGTAPSPDGRSVVFAIRTAAATPTSLWVRAWIR